MNKRLFKIALLLFSFSFYAQNNILKDTISNWQVYKGQLLLAEFNEFTLEKKIILK